MDRRLQASSWFPIFLLLRYSYPFDDLEHIQTGTNKMHWCEDVYKSTISFSVLDEMWLCCQGRDPENVVE